MRIAIGCDHAGYDLKMEIKGYLVKRTDEYKDFGTNSKDPCDYPDIALQVAKAIANGDFDCGILVCGTGIGMSMAADKVPGIRAAAAFDTFTARMSRSHNDANILCLGARVTGVGLALDIVKVWLEEKFSGVARHSDRIGKISLIDKQYRIGSIPNDK
jgi:ribose 5-phosphate isomerase B